MVSLGFLASTFVDSTGSAGVVFGLTRVVVESSFASALLEFLLLWLGSGRLGRYSGIRAQGSNEICNELITMAIPKKGSECKLRESVAAIAGCASCERGCCFARAAVGFILGLRVYVGLTSFARAKQILVCRVAPLVECCDTYLWLLPALCWLVANSGEVLPEFFSVGSGEELFVVVLVRVPLPLGLLLYSLKSSTVLPPWFEASVVCFPELLVVVRVRFALGTVPGLTVPWWFCWRFSQNQFVMLPLSAVFFTVGRLFGLRSGDDF
ncbi:hypothetical protein Taro_032398 [Colocasia esculenta]|uniref:Uncharacterized protein n=1 Tax=Colocasia esculenta TaxID=4460 RepID=A0A843W3T5_COLES|nr:hypothetical protein [Colocasia esculenta]